MSLPEVLLWQRIRRTKGKELNIRRQVPVLDYYLDFGHFPTKTGFEIDGRCHDWRVVRDIQRQAALENEGWSVVHFSAKSVLEDPAYVAQAMFDLIEKKLSDEPQV